jgi:hypothetical protein
MLYLQRQHPYNKMYRPPHLRPNSLDVIANARVEHEETTPCNSGFRSHRMAQDLEEKEEMEAELIWEKSPKRHCPSSCSVYSERFRDLGKITDPLSSSANMLAEIRDIMFDKPIEADAQVLLSAVKSAERALNSIQNVLINIKAKAKAVK